MGLRLTVGISSKISPSTALGTLAYAQAIANSGAISAVTDAPSLTVTFNQTIGRRYRISASAVWQSTVAADVLTGFLTTSANAQLQEDDWTVPIANAFGRLKLDYVFVAASSAAVTFKVRHQRTTGTGTSNLLAGATYPAFIRAEDIGT